MEHINDTTVMVESEGELRTILEANNGYTLIYLGADIALTSRITVNNARAAVTIDGFYPPDETGSRHILSDGNSNTQQIFLDYASATEITFQNMTINGRNYYGILRVYDNSNTQNAKAIFKNLTYVGPQLIWHPWGITHILDCDITIQAAYSSPQEVGEVNRITIGGTTTIQHNSITDSVFWIYKSNGSFTLLDDAVLDVTSARSFIYREAYIPITIGKRAIFTLRTNAGFSHDSGHWMGNVLIDEDAVFHHYRLKNNIETHSMFVNGTFTVNRGADVLMRADYEDDGTLLRFTSASARLYLYNPKSFIIYKAGTSNGDRAMSFPGTIQYEFNGNQINHWTIPGPGTFSDIAPGRWHKKDWSSFMVKGSASSSTTGTTVSEKTITDTEIAEQGLAPISNMQLSTARVFSVGYLPLDVNLIVDDGRPITGVTVPDSDVMAERVVGAPSPMYNTYADELGDFSIPIMEMTVFGDTYKVAANIPYLITSRLIDTVDVGEITLHYVPPQIAFENTPISTSPVLLRRKLLPSGEEDPVIVSDTRADRTPWELWARITGPLQTDDGKYVLRDAVVFADPLGNLNTLDDEFQFVYYTEPTQYGENSIDVTWEYNRGLLARITDTLWSRKEYKTHVVWEVRESQDDGEEDNEEDGG